MGFFENYCESAELLEGKHGIRMVFDPEVPGSDRSLLETLRRENDFYTLQAAFTTPLKIDKNTDRFYPATIRDRKKIACAYTAFIVPPEAESSKPDDTLSPF